MKPVIDIIPLAPNPIFRDINQEDIPEANGIVVTTSTKIGITFPITTPNPPFRDNPQDFEERTRALGTPTANLDVTQATSLQHDIKAQISGACERPASGEIGIDSISGVSLSRFQGCTKISDLSLSMIR